MLGLFAMALITYNFASPQFFKYLFFYNFLTKEYTINDFYPISWSLAAEEYYYLIFPLFMLLCPGGSLLKKVGIFIGAGLAFKIGFAFFHDQAFIRIGTLTRFDSIGIGFLCFLLKDRFTIKHMAVAAVVGLIATALHYRYHSSASVLFFMYALNFGFGVVCAMAFQREKRAPCSNAAFRWVSNLIGSTSYAVYVVHLPVLAIAAKAHIDLVTYMVIVLTLSVAIHQYFERPLLAMRPKYRSK